MTPLPVLDTALVAAANRVATGANIHRVGTALALYQYGVLRAIRREHDPDPVLRQRIRARAHELHVQLATLVGEIVQGTGD